MSGGRLQRSLVAASVLLPALVLRVRLLATTDWGEAVLLDDLAGFAADFGVAGVISVLLLLALRLSFGLGLAFLALWLAANVVAYESIRALDALPSFRDAGYLTDPTFLLGSSWAAFRTGPAPWIGLASVALFWVGRKATASGRQLLVGAALCGLILGLHTAVAWNPEVADWRQTHVLIHNWANAVAERPPIPSNPDLGKVTSDLAADLSGELWIGARPAAPNVLLVLVESISGAYLATTAEAHGRSPRPAMPRLDAFARQHATYTTFLTQGINTNRGLYAVLCGDLPKLLPGTPKMSLLAASGRDGCLPDLLRKAGYRTSYLQAAPLAFMLKDQFLPRIGFDEVRGAASFRAARVRSAWGVDDGTLFQAAIRLVSRFRNSEQGGAPWFLTLLTVGTHHPYLVPADFAPHVDDDFARAVAFADLEVTRFLGALVRLGVLEDTLVLVSSDESRGLRGEADPVSLIASQSWGLLVAAGPGIGTRRVDRAFASSDLPLSVLDYLSLAEPDRYAQLLGRSVFRDDSLPRYVFFGNTRRNALGAVDPEGRLLLCRHRLRHCEAFESATGVFSARRRSVPWSAAGGGILAAIGSFSLTSGLPPEPLRSLELMAAGRVEVIEGPRMLHGGQNVRIAPGEWLEVELSVVAEGGSGVELHTILRDPLRVHLDVRRELPVGQRLTLRYVLAPDESIDKIQCMTTASPLDPGSGATALDFEVARMQLHSSGERPPPGLTILRDTTEPRALP